MITIDLTDEQAIVLLDVLKRNQRAILDPLDPRRFTLSTIEDTLLTAMKERYGD